MEVVPSFDPEKYVQNLKKKTIIKMFLPKTNLFLSSMTCDFSNLQPTEDINIEEIWIIQAACSYIPQDPKKKGISH